MRILPYIIIFALSGCSLYEAPEVPEIEAPEVFKVSIKTVDQKLEDEWWKNFHDKQLNELVGLALKNNYSYQIAVKNIEIAQTYISQNRSYLFPQVGAGYDTSRNKINEAEFFGAFSGGGGTPQFGANSLANPALSSVNTGFGSAPFNVEILSANVSYELDVWNQIRNSVNEAKANTAASAANSNVVKLTLISNVVNAYYQIMALNYNIENLKKQHKAIAEIILLTQVQQESGLIDATSVYNNKIQKETLHTNINTLEKQKQVLEYSLAYLVSEYPENFDIEPKGTLAKVHFTRLIPAGVPSTMLAMRPDIQAAYYQVLSSGYVEKQSLANFLPSFTITGLYGYADEHFGRLLQSPNAFWSYGLGVSQFVFDYAVRESEYKRAKTQYEANVLSYKDTVTNAFKEVNSALISYKEDNEALNAVERQRLHYRELLELSNAQYQAGLINYITYLNSDLSLLQSDYAVNSQQLLVVQDIIQVYKTLGLGLNNK
jgi:multidrug efflux system outer membrane protein